jgi:hypothetical protein
MKKQKRAAGKLPGSQTKTELCAIEFSSSKDYEEFVKGNPTLANSQTLQAGPYILIFVLMSDFPTRDIEERFDSQGRLRAKFIGPDALSSGFIKSALLPPGEEKGFRPEAVV